MDNRDRVAIVGIGGIFPGAGSLEEFWENVRSGVSASRETPPGRWLLPPEQAYAPELANDKVYSTRACFVETFELDLSGLDLDAELVAKLDPLVHLLLHAGRDAFRDAVMSEVDHARVGVALGNIALPTDSSSALAVEILGRTFAEQATGRDAAAPTQTHPLNRYVTGLPAGLLAQGLGIGGGTVTLDSACASSLYALKLAADELLSGRADAMLAGGVSRPDCLYTQMGFSQLRALSPTGRCSPFDRQADGLVVGEGAGVVVLKRLEDALRAGDRIYATIAGIGLSNDIGGNLLAPDSEGQLRAMREAYRRAGWSPRDVDLIECHGTGTPVGDAVEFESLKQLRGEEDAAAPCVIGSVKSNVGHLLTGAGAAGLIKVLLAMNHRTLPPTANFQQPAEKLGLDRTSLRVLARAEEWSRRAPNVPRKAAVSAFGFGGINAHVLLEEWDPSLAAASTTVSVAADRSTAPVPIAIVGAACRLGGASDLRQFAQRALLGLDLVPPRRNPNWWGIDRSRWFSKEDPNGESAIGRPIETIRTPFQRFRIPPVELQEMLPQQLLMLEAAADALEDAGKLEDVRRERTGVFIGIGLDLNTTNFHFRWWIQTQAAKWAEQLGLDLDAEELEQWTRQLRDAAGPPLTANRTMGALGGIVASRIAREFRVGGPSFTLSSEESSGMRALQAAVRALQQGEIDDAIVGGVDFNTEVRVAIAGRRLQSLSPPGMFCDSSHPPGDGAVAFILKRLEDAQRDGDQIYATIDGVGAANASSQTPLAEARLQALARACQDAQTHEQDIELWETTADVLTVDSEHGPLAIGQVEEVVGRTGAASGLVCVLRAALALRHRVLPADGYKNGETSPSRNPKYWLHDSEKGPRTAAADCYSVDGNCVAAVLRSAPVAKVESVMPACFRSPDALFVCRGDSPDELAAALQQLIDAAGRETAKSAEQLAAQWWAARQTQGRLAVALIAGDHETLIRQARDSVESLRSRPGTKLPAARGRVFYSPEPLCGSDADDKLAFVFPGSGNHFPGMGRELCLYWPEVAARQEEESRCLRSQLLPDLLWADDPSVLANATPQQLILSQVSLGALVRDVVAQFGVRATAAIGYSLGETTALFATRAWRDRDEMLRRLSESPLFQEQLAGPCLAARKAWGLSGDEDVDWIVGVVDLPAERVRAELTGRRRVYLLMINTADECVVGGRNEDVRGLVAHLGCRFFPLHGVSTVHCHIVDEVADAYRELHLLPTTPPPGMRYYSSSWGRRYELTRESAAEAILANAQVGADFPATVQSAYADGIRVFVEMGPGMSCSRMIGRILGDRPHLAQSACVAGQDARLTILRLLGALLAEGVPVDLAPLFKPVLEESSTGRSASIRSQPVQPDPRRGVEVLAGGLEFRIPTPPSPSKKIAPQPVAAVAETPPSQPSVSVWEPAAPTTTEPHTTIEWTTPSTTTDEFSDAFAQPQTVNASSQELLEAGAAGYDMPMTKTPFESAELVSPLLKQASETLTAAAEAHAAYLQFSENMTKLMAQQLQQLASPTVEVVQPSAVTGAVDAAAAVPAPVQQRPVLPGATPDDEAFMGRAQCMEFAVGSIAAVLGPEFAEVDQHPTRVRLPDEPLMLADRIVSVEGEPRSMTSGRVVTEHDVLPGAWYLDGGRIPTCIAVEAGQADLFLSGYLGIDFITKGHAVYRLLDAVVTFHQSLPRPGSVIRYDIRIERFFRQGDTYLFRFSFDSTVNGQPLLTMRDGCAGFFTDEELQAGKGVLHTKLDLQRLPGKRPDDWVTLAPMRVESYSDEQIGALRRGDLQACFGEPFGRLPLRNPMRLPCGRMTLIHRVTHLDPTGGRFGLGQIRAEADIHPDDWFLTCHFVDDRVMPGTLMYECCMHTLRVFLMRMGWVAEDDQCAWEPVPGVASRLKCRGQVIESTKTATYEITLKEIGYRPEPYAIADALMYADGKAIVEITDMSVRLDGANRQVIEALWSGIAASSTPAVNVSSPVVQVSAPTEVQRRPAIFDRDRILAFAIGKPSEAFGDRYRVFDEERVIARLPGPPYQFLDRITYINAEQWKMVAGGTVEGEYDVPPDAWYFAADRQPSMPFAVLLEVGLQVCGWLAAYLGSALTSETDLSFRNLGGKAMQHVPVFPDVGTLTTFVKITRVSSSGGMIIQNFDFEVRDDRQVVYSGDTYFGFFSKEALAQQIGIRDARPYQPTEAEIARGESFAYPTESPFPDKQMRMMENVDLFVPDGGPHGLGFLRGSKPVDPDEWFFKAHFYQDPVNPGSLGLEAFVQLLKLYAVRRWGGTPDSWLLPMVNPKPHEWIYRGQVIPTNRHVTVDAVVTAVDDARQTLCADGFLAVDGRIIYQMKDFTLTMSGKPR